MKIGIYGVSGFVGSHVTRRLLSLGHTIIGFSRTKPYLFSHPYFQREYCNLRDQETYGAHSFDCVIYCIAEASYTSQNSTINSFKQLIQSFRTEKIIYISSSSIYMGTYGTIDENETIQEHNLNRYGLNKWDEEQYLLTYCANTNIALTILRPRAIYGIGDKVVLYSILSMNINKHLIYGSYNKQLQTSLTNIETLIDAILHTVNHSLTGIYNIADNQTYILYDVYKTINKSIRDKHPICLPYGLIKLYLSTNNDKKKGFEDIFGGNKILDTTKITYQGFTSPHNFYESMPTISLRRKNKIGNMKNMKTHLHHLPWMT